MFFSSPYLDQALGHQLDGHIFGLFRIVGSDQQRPVFASGRRNGVRHAAQNRFSDHQLAEELPGLPRPGVVRGGRGGVVGAAGATRQTWGVDLGQRQGALGGRAVTRLTADHHRAAVVNLKRK